MRFSLPRELKAGGWERLAGGGVLVHPEFGAGELGFTPDQAQAVQAWLDRKVAAMQLERQVLVQRAEVLERERDWLAAECTHVEDLRAELEERAGVLLRQLEDAQGLVRTSLTSLEAIDRTKKEAKKP